MYTNNSSIMPNLSKLKKIKCNQVILDQSWGLILSSSIWNCNVIRSTNESTCNWPITEWIHCDELLFNTTYQSSSTNWPNLFSRSQWQTATGQSKAKYKLHHQYVECLQYRNSKSSRQKLHFLNVNISASTQFINLRLWGFIVIILIYTQAKFLSKSEVWPKIWLEGLQKY